MPHLEVNSWIEAYLTSQGVKKPQQAVRFNPETTIVSQRRAKPTEGA